MSAASDFRDWAEDLQRAARRAVKTAVGTATQGALTDLRAAIVSASTERAGYMIGAEVFPRRDSINAAGSVYARGDLAADIVEAMQTGPVIQGDPFLAIPTAAVPRTAKGRRLTPTEATKHFGVPLKLKPGKRPGTWLLFASLTRALSKRRPGYRAPTARRLAKGRAAEDVLLFVLVPRIKFPKLIGAAAIADKWGALVPPLIARNLDGG